MADDTYKLNAELDTEYETKFDLLQAEYGHEGHGAVKATVYDIIDAAFEANDLDLDDAVASDDDSDEEPLYNPYDHSESLTLDRDLLRDVLREYNRPAIHPTHVSNAELPKSVAEKTAAVVAVARYRYLAEEGDPEWTPDNVSDLQREVQNVIGDADNRTVSKYREAAFERINDDGVGRPDNIRPSDVLNIDSVEEWVAETEREFIGCGDELPAAALEKRREMAAELFQWVAPHEGVQKCLDELDTAIDVATDGEEDAEENQSDDAGSDDGESGDKLEEMERIERAEEPDDEDENQPAGDRSEEEMAREVAERSGGEQEIENQQPIDDTDAEMVDITSGDGDESDS